MPPKTNGSRRSQKKTTKRTSTVKTARNGKTKKQVVTKTIINNTPKPSKARRIMQSQNRGAAKGYTRGLPKGVTREIKQVALSSLLPYEGPLIRTRPGSITSVSIPSAVTRHFEYHDINFASLFSPAITPIVQPTLADGVPIWGNLSEGIPIVSVLDPYLNMIVPSRFQQQLTPITQRIMYDCKEFMNSNQLAEGEFIFHPNANYQGQYFGQPDFASRIYVSRDRPYWLDPVEFRPFQGPSGFAESTYGQLMSCFDATLAGEASRFVWFDAINLSDNYTNTEETGFMQMNFRLPSGFSVVQTEGSTSLTFVAERLTDTTDNATETFSAFFLAGNGPTASPNTISANLHLVTSGYYRFGITGYISRTDGNPSGTALVLSDVYMRYIPDPRINIFTRHLVNSNVFTTGSSSGNSIFFQSVKPISGSLLLRNTTPNVAKGGMVFSMSSVTNNIWSRLSSDHDIIRNLNSTTAQNSPVITYNGPLEKGCYGWLRNNTREFRSFTEVTKYKDGGSVSCIRSFSISRRGLSDQVNQSAMNVYLIVPPTPVMTESSVIPNLTITCLACVQFEYTTTNQTPVVSATSFDNEAYEGAMSILQQTPTFTENPLHIDSFINAIRRVGGRLANIYSMARPMLKPVYSAMSAFGPTAGVLGRVANAVDDVLF